MTKIVCAALRHRESGHIIAGVRHYDPVMLDLIFMIGGPGGWSEWGNTRVEHGFLDSDGKFHGSKSALKIAVEAGQMKIDGQRSHLFPEDIW